MVASNGNKRIRNLRQGEEGSLGFRHRFGPWSGQDPRAPFPSLRVPPRQVTVRRRERFRLSLGFVFLPNFEEDFFSSGGGIKFSGTARFFFQALQDFFLGHCKFFLRLMEWSIIPCPLLCWVMHRSNPS
jgi:hypothetical protein